VVLGAVYLLHLFQKLMFGTITLPENATLPDLRLREALCFLPLLVLIVGMGIYPKPFLERIEPSSAAAVDAFHLKRCVSIKQTEAGAQRPVLLSRAKAAVEACADPVSVIADTYGDTRALTQRRRARASAQARARATEAAAAREAEAAAQAQAAAGAPKKPVAGGAQ
jgi:hypothetical protein